MDQIHTLSPSHNTSTGTMSLLGSGREGYLSQVRMGYPPLQDKPWTAYAAVGTSLAVSRRRTFLFRRFGHGTIAKHFGFYSKLMPGPKIQENYQTGSDACMIKPVFHARKWGIVNDSQFMEEIFHLGEISERLYKIYSSCNL